LSIQLDQLLRDAGVLAEEVQRERRRCTRGSDLGHELRALEDRLAHTWTAIRLARAPGGIADEQRRRPKWG
jgi:hypothetical protein